MRRPVLIARVLLVLATAGLIAWASGTHSVLERWQRGPLRVSGIVWQLDASTVDIAGNWQELGADHLLIQWSKVDGVSFLESASQRRPDWLRISRESWAQHVILGLAGHFDERRARGDAVSLARESLSLADARLPLNVEGYYFPVEVDPTWQEAPDTMGNALALLPRPLWVSVYDNTNLGAEALADWLASWLPPDVGVFFQDGVGVEARTPGVARQYADALASRLGRQRLKVIVEAFRPESAGRFRAATPQELMPQIKAMQGYDVYLFDGPHYLDERRVRDLAEAMKAY